jgi:hypothetical protein
VTARSLKRRRPLQAGGKTAEYSADGRTAWRTARRTRVTRHPLNLRLKHARARVRTHAVFARTCAHVISHASVRTLAKFARICVIHAHVPSAWPLTCVQTKVRTPHAFQYARSAAHAARNKPRLSCLTTLHDPRWFRCSRTMKCLVFARPGTGAPCVSLIPRSY